MNKAILAALLVALPSLAHAQTQVPAIQANANAGATAAVNTMALPNRGPSDHMASATAVSTPPATSAPPSAASNVPPGMPPAIPLISSAVAPLNPKERHAVALSRRWANRNEMPHAGEDGYVRFLYGATLPTVVCAPLQVCNLALQPGEIVNNINLGDSVRWKITPSLSGSGGVQTTHLIIKPTDAGLMSSLDVETNKRTYAIKLVSTQASWMPLVAFNYPEDAQDQWQAYHQAVGYASSSEAIAGGSVNASNLSFYCISGSPSWAPVRAYSDGAKTYIEFAHALNFQAAPALTALANDGSWFTSPSKLMINYRVQGDRYVVDAVLDRAALISGVGGGQERVTLYLGASCR
jgi:P-type conjugative transfer protein TrbG